MNTLHAGNLVLEPQVTGHAAEMFRVLSDPAIYEFENEPPESLAWLERRYARLESRRSADGSEQWLNWVVRLPSGRLAGYVQATITPEAVAYVAYELASTFWRQGIGRAAVGAMLDELEATYSVRTFVAVLKAGNFRSVGLLRRLGFSVAPPDGLEPVAHQDDEVAMYKACRPGRHAACQRAGQVDPGNDARNLVPAPAGSGSPVTDREGAAERSTEWLGEQVQIRIDDLSGPEIRALLEEHLESMYRLSPPESVHALGIDALREPDITFWTAWAEDTLLGCGALKELDPSHGEIKSMRTARAHLRRGVARAMLAHIVDEARRRSYVRVSLETGSMAAFEPARRLYEHFGFAYCAPFSDYVDDPNSVFMTLALRTERSNRPDPLPQDSKPATGHPTR